MSSGGNAFNSGLGALDEGEPDNPGNATTDLSQVWHGGAPK